MGLQNYLTAGMAVLCVALPACGSLNAQRMDPQRCENAKKKAGHTTAEIDFRFVTRGIRAGVDAIDPDLSEKYFYCQEIPRLEMVIGEIDEGCSPSDREAQKIRARVASLRDRIESVVEGEGIPDCTK